MSINASTIYIHTDNKADLYALRSHNKLDNLSAATNLHALEKQFTNIKFEYMPTKRSLLHMDNSKNICVVNKLKTKERKEKFIFSQPVNIFLSRRLYQSTSYPPLNISESGSNRVSLSDIFVEQPNTKMLLSTQISYGDALDAQIALISDVNIVTRHSAEQDIGITAMFARGRAEFALLYPHQVYGSSFKINARSYSLNSIPPYVLGYLMCTKNDITKDFLNNVNNHLSKPNSLNKLLEIHLNYTNPIDKMVIESFFDEVFY
jgi:hypothetical protein